MQGGVIVTSTEMTIYEILRWADRFNFSQERDGEKHGEERGRVQ